MMVECNKSLGDVLSAFDGRTEPFAEHQISDAVHRLRDKDDPSPPPMEWLAEAMAFDFCENHADKETGWGTYFGPKMSGTEEDGSHFEAPSIRLVTPEILDYWAKRAREAKNPILKVRYAGLVWDLTRRVTDQSPPYEMAQIRIDGVIEMAATKVHKYESQVISKLEHALHLAIVLDDVTRIGRVRNAILDYEDEVAQDDKVGLWGFAFDLLWGNKKVPLTEAQKVKIISDLEGRLKRVGDTSGNQPRDPWVAEAAALRLARYYRAENRPEDTERVLLKYGVAFEKIAEVAAAMLGQAWLEKVCQVYRDFGLKDDAQRLLRRIRELGPKARQDLKTISAQVEIKREEMEKYVQELTEGGLETALGKIALHYVPRRGEIEKEIKDLASKAPLTFLFQAQLVDHKGRPTALVGPIENDLDGRVIMHMSQTIQFSAIFLRHVMGGVMSKFAIDHNQFSEYVCRSPVFDDDGQTIVRAGIKRYFEGDTLAAIHLLVPQVENAIRNLVENAGGTVLKPNRSGGFDLKTFDELLRDDRVSAVFGEDIPLYMRVLFTDRRGVNLRNDLCHGMAPVATLGLGMADRVVHALLILAQVRVTQGTPEGEQTE